MPGVMAGSFTGEASNTHADGVKVARKLPPLMRPRSQYVRPIRPGLDPTSGPPAMEAYRVSRAVNTPRNNQEALLQQVE